MYWGHKQIACLRTLTTCSDGVAVNRLHGNRSAAWIISAMFLSDPPQLKPSSPVTEWSEKGRKQLQREVKTFKTLGYLLEWRTSPHLRKTWMLLPFELLSLCGQVELRNRRERKSVLVKVKWITSSSPPLSILFIVTAHVSDSQKVGNVDIYAEAVVNGSPCQCTTPGYATCCK